MKTLLMILVLLCVACGAEFQGTGDDLGEAGASVGAAGSSSSAGAGVGGSSTAGSSGAPSAGTGNVAGGSAGSASGGSGGTPITCDAPLVELPTEFSIPDWHMEVGDACASTTAPVVCQIQWGEPIVDGESFQVQLYIADCGTVNFKHGFCGEEAQLCDGVIRKNPDSHPWFGFELFNDGSGYLVSSMDASDHIGLSDESDCSNGIAGTGPSSWPSEAQAAVNRAFRTFLEGLAFGCVEN